MSKKKDVDLSIDAYALDEEWMDQPSRYKQAADWAAMARKEYDEAKSDLDVVKAELDRDIRTDPSKFNIEVKLTETVIANLILRRPKYRESMQEVIDKKHQLDVMSGLVVALDHRKSALSKLVDLHLASYYSKPKASEKARENVEEVEKRSARRKAARRLNRKDE